MTWVDEEERGTNIYLSLASTTHPSSSPFTPIVFVSSDTDAKSLNAVQAENKWPYAVPFDSPLRSSFKQTYKVWSMREDDSFKGKRESGIPTIMVVDEQGKELAHLDVGMDGAGVLDEWKYIEWVWPK